MEMLNLLILDFVLLIHSIISLVLLMILFFSVTRLLNRSEHHETSQIPFLTKELKKAASSDISYITHLSTATLDHHQVFSH